MLNDKRCWELHSYDIWIGMVHSFDSITQPYIHRGTAILGDCNTFTHSAMVYGRVKLDMKSIALILC